MILIPIFGLLNRLGGGLVKLGSTHLSRILFRSLPTALVVFYISHKYWALSLALVLGWLGWVLAKYSKYWNLTSLRDWLLMAWNGLLTSVFPAAVFIPFNPLGALYVALSGLFMPLCYWLGHRTPNLGKGFNSGPEMGEFYFGCVRGVALWLTLN